MTTEGLRPSQYRLEEAKLSRDALASALHRADLQLLALRLDPSTTADEALHPLVDLGHCSPRTARALATVIEQGVER